MKTLALTTAQQSQAATLKSAVTSAQTAVQAARKALNTYLQTAASAPKHARVSLTDDGTTIVIQ
jgi:hypothetical protein